MQKERERKYVNFFFECVACNRLDLPTSGLMLIARNSTRAQMIEREMSSGQIQKEYICRVDGKFPE